MRIKNRILSSLISIVLFSIITGCSSFDTQNPPSQTNKETTQTENLSPKRVDVTLQAKDEQGNLVPNVVFRVDQTITEDIGLKPDEDGIQTLNLEANSKHRVKVDFGNSIVTIEEFLVKDEPMTFDIIKPE